MKLIPTLVTAPTSEVLSLDALKQSLRIDHTYQDAILQSYINAATNRVDGYNGILGIALSSQQWSVRMEAFSDCISLPIGPLISVDEIAYYDQTNTLRTITGSQITDLCSSFETTTGPVIELNYNEQWPNTYTRRDAVSVKWTCGHSSVPEAIKQAIALIASSWFESGGVPEAVDFAGLPPAAKALLFPFNRIPT